MMRTLTIAVFGMCVVCAAEAGNGWVKYEGNPVLEDPVNLGICFDVNVIRGTETTFSMYFSWRPKKAIALVKGNDGVTWSEPTICLDAVPASGWEDDLNRSCTVFKDGVYHMWYTGQARGYSKIGYAVSRDGVAFTRLSKLPVMIPEHPWEGFSVMNPYVHWDAAREVWRMWYASGETYEPNVLCYAESKDGFKWEKSLMNPIFVKGVHGSWEQDRIGGCEVHLLPDGRWIMFYIGYSDIHTARIGAAVSPDGVTRWKRLKTNPIVSPTPGTFDASACYKPSVYRDVKGDRWLLWYNGRRDKDEYIGLVIHKGIDLE